MSLIPGIPVEASAKILALFASAPPGTKVILFGSRAKGNFREGSDIDLAIKGPVTLDDRSRWSLAYDDLYLPWKLDLAIYHLIEEPALKEHIDRVGLTLN